jgi:hypothetical protein
MYIFFEFLTRLIGFSVTFYYLLEYVLTSKIDTKLGLWLTFILCIIVMLFFKFYTFKNISKCDSCSQAIVKKNFIPSFIQNNSLLNHSH